MVRPVTAPPRPRAPATQVSRRGRARTAPAALALLILVLATSAAGCPCVNSVVNASDGLRWWLFSGWGAQRVCPEMLQHGGVALRLGESAAATGRFFPKECNYRVDDANRTMTVDFVGTGYAYVAPARRVGFSATVSVEYRPDFQLAGDDVYVWARLSRVVAGPAFQLGYVENPIASAATNLGPIAALANQIGNQIVESELGRGFTVVHNEDTGNEFGLGIILPPRRPTRPYDTSEDDAFTFANETVEIHAGQRDYLGAFAIEDDDQKLVLKLAVEGPNGLDVLVLQKAYGDAWREAYQTGRDVGPPAPVLTSFPIGPGFSTRELKLPPGHYTVVVDNTPLVGTMAPASQPSVVGLWSSSVKLSYVAQRVEE
jgi:hypothetical protein